jgi:BirA family biotin operon repressor/biotin-[acetyl-CoA-carboxylase] ligase
MPVADASSGHPGIDANRLGASPQLAGFEWHHRLGSTNDLALEQALQPGLRTPRLIGAELQTGGRGRGRNQWWSNVGALTFSLILDPDADLRRQSAGPLAEQAWPRLSLCAAVALCDVLEERVPCGKPGLKWPNDVQVSGRKVAGILLETCPAPPGTARRLVIGVGINVNNSFVDAPEELRAVGASLSDLAGGLFDRTELLLAWVKGFLERAAALARGDPLLAQRWRSLCTLTGRQITLLAGDREVHGLCAGIDDHGALVVETPHRQERLFGGVVVRALSCAPRAVPQGPGHGFSQ